MARKIFLRGKWRTYSKLGRGRKKKQKYRKPKGRHNKIREKMKGNPKKVSIGYKKKKKIEKILRISNIKELERIENIKGKGEKVRVILSNIGKKNKIEIAKKAKEMSIEIINLNIPKFLKKVEKEAEKNEKKTEKMKKEEKKEKPKEDKQLEEKKEKEKVEKAKEKQEVEEKK